MKYIMLTNETKEDFAARTDDARKEQYWTGWLSFIQAMKDSGVLSHPGNVLHPKHTSITVSVVDGEVRTSEGAEMPDTFPQLSGYFILEVQDADEAVRWASLAPAAVSGSIELRPLL